MDPNKTYLDVNKTFFGVLLLLSAAVTGFSGYHALMQANQLVMDTVLAGSVNPVQLGTRWANIILWFTVSIVVGTVLLVIGAFQAFSRHLVWRLSMKVKALDPAGEQ
ncbi:hypothetical protein [Pseudomonas putida]|uniref:hypothetical protein n=1 Tax=Pseudomonas putida TaxID=303 RepID=UPI003809FC9F